MSAITITNVSKIGANTYNVDFYANFNISNLAYQTSLNGTDWSESISLGSVSSPAIVTVENLVNFNIRLLTNYVAPIPIDPNPPTPERIHTSAFNQVFN